MCIQGVVKEISTAEGLYSNAIAQSAASSLVVKEGSS